MQLAKFICILQHILFFPPSLLELYYDEHRIPEKQIFFFLQIQNRDEDGRVVFLAHALRMPYMEDLL